MEAVSKQGEDAAKSTQNERSEARWVAIAALPLDLQVVLQRSIDWRQPGAPPLPRRPLYIGLFLSLMAASGVISSRSEAFSSVPLLFSLVVGPFLVLRYWITVRGQGFRSRRFIAIATGPASLVQIHATHVRVLPAEALNVDGTRIYYGAEKVDQEDNDATLLSHVKDLIEAAKQRPELIERDRFRAAALQTPSLHAFDVRWRKHEALVLAAGLVVASALLVEAGPLHANGDAARRDAAAALTIEQWRRDLNASHDSLLARAAAAAHTVNREPKRARALEGTMEDARLFLSEFGVTDPSAHKVQDRLLSLCEKEIVLSDRDDPATRALFAMLLSVCATPDGTLYYEHTGALSETRVESLLRFQLWEMVKQKTASLRAHHPPSLHFRLHTGSSKTSGYPFIQVTSKLSFGSPSSGITARYDIAITPMDELGLAYPKAILRLLRANP